MFDSVSDPKTTRTAPITSEQGLRGLPVGQSESEKGVPAAEVLVFENAVRIVWLDCTRSILVDLIVCWGFVGFGSVLFPSVKWMHLDLFVVGTVKQ